MTLIYLPNRGLLANALTAGMVRADTSQAAVRYAVDDQGGLWIQPSVPLTKSTINALAKLGGVVRTNDSITLDRFASCWAEMLPIEPAIEVSADRVLVEWTDLARMPEWSVLLRRLGAKIAGWRMDVDRQRVLALVESTPYHTLAQPLPPGWRTFVEQTPRFWVESGFRHPLDLAFSGNNDVLVRHDGRWEHFTPLEPVERNARFHISAKPTFITKDRSITVAITPRLISDTRTVKPTFWVLPGNGDEVLTAWLQHTDDRLVRQLQVARLITSSGPKIVLLANAETDRAPLLLIDAAGYQQYLKLNNLFIPLGRRLTPNLRRDVARRTYAPRDDELVWLDDDGQRGMVSTSIPLNLFRPLIEMTRYQAPRTQERNVAAIAPLFNAIPFIVRDRPAPKIRPKPAAPLVATTPTEEQTSLMATLFSWIKGAWQITSTVTAPPPAETKSIPELSLPPPPSDQGKVASQWRDQADAVRTTVHSGRSVSAAALADLARSSLREQRYADAAWCWLQILWQADQPNLSAATGWVQCENLLANAAKGNATPNPSEWTIGQLAAQIVRWSLANESWPVPADAALKYIVENDNDLSIKAAWLAHRALAQQAGNDVLNLARARDRLFMRLLQHGLRLEVDVPIFLRSEDAERAERLAAVRDWLIKSQETVARWLGDRTTGLSTERLLANDRLERFGLARERINTVYYAHLMICWGLAIVGATSAAAELVESAGSGLPGDDPVHAWLTAGFRHRIDQAGLGGRTTPRWPEDLQSRWLHLSSSHRFAVDRLRQASRILEPLENIDPFEMARTGGDSPMAQLAMARETDLPGVVENLLRRVRPTSAARLPVLTQALRVAPQAGETLVRSLTDQLLLELDPFIGSEAQWRGVQAALTAVATMQLPEIGERLLDRWLQWCRRADELTPGIDHALAEAIPALQRLNLDSALTDLIAATQRLLPSSQLDAANRVLIDRTRVVLAGGWLSVGQDNTAMKVLDDTRRLLFTQNDYRTRDRLSLAVCYVDSLRFAPVRVAIGRMDEIMQRLPAPTDVFATNAYYSLSSLRLLDAMVRAAANEDLTLGIRVRRWLDAEEYGIRRRIQKDLECVMGTKIS